MKPHAKHDSNRTHELLDLSCGGTRVLRAACALDRRDAPSHDRVTLSHHVYAGEAFVVVADGHPPRLDTLLPVHVRESVPLALRVIA